MVRQRLRAGGMFLALALACRADEPAAVQAIKQLGGRVTIDDTLPGKPVVGVSFFQRKITDAALEELKEFKSLQDLDLRYTQITDEGLKHLRELRSLETLYLDFTRGTDAGLQELKELRSLRLISLIRTQVTD